MSVAPPPFSGSGRPGAATALLILGRAIDREVAQRAHLLLLQPFARAVRMEGVQARQRADGVAHIDILEADTARAQLLGQFVDVVNDPRRGAAVNLLLGRAGRVLLQVLDKLAQDE